jgi:homoserine dehydrogenase
MIAVGFLGCGKVGSALYELLCLRPIPNLTIKSMVVANPASEAHRAIIGSGVKLTNKWDEVLKDPQIDIIVETIGTPQGEGQSIEILANQICQATRSGKSFVTANKKLLARHWDELVKASSDKNVAIGFEASVGGSIPIIEPLRARQQLNEVLSIIGILNSTSNFILTRMAQGENYLGALSRAREHGLTESNPAEDVEGDDAAFKIAILSSLVFGTFITPDSIKHKESIEGIGTDVFTFAGNFDYVVKPVAVSRFRQGRLEIGVYPALLRQNHPLANVNDDFNAVMIESQKSRRHMFYGLGAGPKPTATALYNDLARVVNLIRYGGWEAPLRTSDQIPIAPKDESIRRGYVHVVAPDKPSQLGKIASILGKSNINICQVDQIQREQPGELTPIMLATDPAPLSKIEEALDELKTDSNMSQVRYLPIEELED